ncbi:regulatory signaling modulator protein AmpE [Pseudomonas sp. MT3]
MSFLVLLLVLLVEKLSSWRARLQRDSLWLGWLDSVGGAPSLTARPWLGLLVAVLPPLLLLALLLTLLDPVAYGLLALPVHLLVVVWSLGRGDILRAVGPFRDAWRREDAQGAYHVARRDLGVQADNDDELLAQVQGTLVWQAYQAFFAVIFWYALLGPVAALTYRLLAIAAEQGRQAELRERAVQLRHALDWLPARALVLSFALVGNFVAVSRSLLHDLLAWDVPAARLLARAGYVAEDFNEGGLGAKGVASLDALWQLLVRSAVLWYAVFAIWTLLL